MCHLPSEAELQRLDVQVRFGQQSLESVVLRFQFLEPLCVFSFHATVLRPPSVETGGTEAMLPA